MSAKKNTCDCPQPPGGRAVCEENQLAICRVKDGNVQTECVDPPAPLRSGMVLSVALRTQYYNWVIAEVTGLPRNLSNPLSGSDQHLLQQGFFHNIATGEIVTFQLPDFLKLAPSVRRTATP